MRKQIITSILTALLASAPLALAADKTPDNATTYKTSEMPSADQIQLHEKPDANSGIVDTIQHNAPITPIFSQTDPAGNVWIKVANPKNGNVGWVKAQDIKQKGYPELYLKTFNDKSGNKDTQGYQVMEYSGSQPLTPKQMETLMQNVQKNQIDMEKTMNQLMQESMNNFNNQMKSMQLQPVYVPVIQPVILVPAKPKPEAVTAPTKAPVKEAAATDKDAAK